jgi:hypothetical protein
MTTIRVLSPQGEARAATHAVPSLPQSLRGLTVGFLDNKKHNFDRLVLEMGELMVARWGVARVVHRQKANAATPAAREIVEALAKECDVVFAGSAD